jgi:hypothetical protein
MDGVPRFSAPFADERDVGDSVKAAHVISAVVSGNSFNSGTL